MPTLRAVAGLEPPPLSMTQVSILERATPVPITTVEALLTHDAEMIASSLQLKRSQVLQLQREVAQHFAARSRTADELARSDDGVGRTPLPTRCAALDALLGGGLGATDVTELAGASCAAKTQICLSVAADVALQGSHVIYFGTCPDALARRLANLVHARGQTTAAGMPEVSHAQTAAAALGRVILRPCHSAQVVLEELTHITARLDAYCSPQADARSATATITTARTGARLLAPAHVSGKTRLLVLDSVAAIVSPLLGKFSGIGAGAKEQHKNPMGHSIMMQIGTLLSHIAARHGVAVLVTNHVVRAHGGWRSGDGGGGSGRGGTKPALGRSWACVPRVRLELKAATGVGECEVDGDGKEGVDKEDLEFARTVVDVALCKSNRAPTVYAVAERATCSVMISGRGLER